MMTSDPRARLLINLLSASQQDETIDVFTLGEGSGLSLYQVLKHLNTLAEAGLVDARRLRLTLQGLAVAASLARSESGRSAEDGERQEPDELWLLADSAA